MPTLQSLYERVAAYLQQVRNATLRDVILYIFGPAFGAIIMDKIRYSSFLFPQLMSFSEFQKMLRDGKVSHVVCGENSLSVTLKNDNRQQYRTLVPSVLGKDKLWDLLNSARSVEVSASRIERIGKQIYDNFLTLAPIAYLAFAGYFMKKILDNGKKDGVDVETTEILSNETIRFADVAGIGGAKAELTSLVHMIKNKNQYSRIGARQPKGILLYGSPGVGKTLLARAIAGECGLPFLHCSGSDFVEVYVGRGAARVRDLFEKARRLCPCIVFIDEIDALAKARGGLHSNDEREQTLNQLLNEMDGFRNSEVLGNIVIAATNRQDSLDKALVRSGRFDYHIFVPKPNKSGRKEILIIHLRKIVISSSADEVADLIADKTNNFSGADLANVVNTAALLAARRCAEKVDIVDFKAALAKIFAERLDHLNIVGSSQMEDF